MTASTPIAMAMPLCGPCLNGPSNKLHARRSSMASSLPVRILRKIAGIGLVLCGLFTLGLYLPSIPVLGEVGPLLTARFGPWLSVLAAIGMVWAFLRWKRDRNRSAMIVCAFALVATIGMT